MMELNSWVVLVTGLFTGLGIGSIVTALIQHLLQKRAAVLESQRQDLEKRYKVIILLMYAAFEFESNKSTLRIQRPDLSSQDDVLGELKAEWYNMLLFASGQTQTNLHAFIVSPTIQNLKNTAMAMRKDLGRDVIEHSLEELNFSS